MRDENKSLIRALLERSVSMQEDIFDDSLDMLGQVPFILETLAERPAFMIFSSLKDFYALRPASLDARTAELLAIAAAASSGAEQCLKVHMRAATQAGASRDEILDAIVIAAIIGQSRVLASSLRVLREFDKGSESKEENKKEDRPSV